MSHLLEESCPSVNHAENEAPNHDYVIPQRLFKSIPSGPCFGIVVEFEPLSPSFQRDPMGVPMIELLYGAKLLEPNDEILQDFCFDEIQLRIMWPGYEWNFWTEKIPIRKSDATITRRQLGMRVADAYWQFLQANAGIPPRGTAEYSLFTDRFGFEKLNLVRVFSVESNNFQADIKWNRTLYPSKWPPVYQRSILY